RDLVLTPAALDAVRDLPVDVGVLEVRRPRGEVEAHPVGVVVTQVPADLQADVAEVPAEDVVARGYLARVDDAVVVGIIPHGRLRLVVESGDDVAADLRARGVLGGEAGGETVDLLVQAGPTGVGRLARSTDGREREGAVRELLHEEC